MKIELSKYSNQNTHRLKRFLWELIWLFLFRPTPRWCLNGWRCWLLRLFGAKIGKNVRIQGSAKIWQPWKLIIDDYSWIDGGVSLYSVDDIVIGSNVVVSESAFICTASHDIHSPVFELITKPIFIQNYAWICARATVLMGATVGEGSVVAAGAVVTKSIESWTVVGGNPAKIISRCITQKTYKPLLKPLAIYF